MSLMPEEKVAKGESYVLHSLDTKHPTINDPLHNANKPNAAVTVGPMPTANQPVSSVLTIAQPAISA